MKTSTITSVQEQAIQRLLGIKDNRYGNGSKTRAATRREHDGDLTELGFRDDQIRHSWTDVIDMVNLEKAAE